MRVLSDTPEPDLLNCPQCTFFLLRIADQKQAASECRLSPSIERQVTASSYAEFIAGTVLINCGAVTPIETYRLISDSTVRSKGRTVSFATNSSPPPTGTGAVGTMTMK